MVNHENKNNIIDRCEIRRARELNRKSKIHTFEQQKHFIKSLYFDGRKDHTLAMIDNRRRKLMEEHIVLVEEPGSKYIVHVSPPIGSAAAIAECMRSFLEESSITQDQLQVIGCDGTNTNTADIKAV